MADVAQKCISNNPIKNGDAVVWVSKTGTIQKVDPQLNKVTDVTDIEAKYTNRFDDPNYYSA